jgi:phosphoribosylamine--glycine ligase
MENSKKNILIVGKGAVVSALARKLFELDEVGGVFVASGNGVSSDYYTNVDIREDDLTGLLKFVLENDIYMTIPVSVEALKSDIVSFFMENDQNIFGPTKGACNLAINKAAGKKFLYKIHAQTSKFGIFDKLNIAQDWLKTATFPVVIRCSEKSSQGDRLVCSTVSLAEQFLDNLFSRNETGILIEEYTYGHNFTVYFMTDGYSAIPFATVGNYKFMEDGNGGLLTEGVGCYTPDYKVSQVIISRVENVVRNTLVALDKKGEPYIGVLGVDCTLTGEDKFYVNEFKAFMQDFDACAVLNSVDENLIGVFVACIQGLFSDEYEVIKTNDLHSLSVVVSSRQKDKPITGINYFDDNCNVDFIQGNGKLTTLGENFVLTSSASTLSRAKNNLYDELSEIKFDGIKYRKDICLN